MRWVVALGCFAASAEPSVTRRAARGAHAVRGSHANSQAEVRPRGTAGVTQRGASRLAHASLELARAEQDRDRPTAGEAAAEHRGR
jgi:hypothetical protein